MSYSNNSISASDLSRIAYCPAQVRAVRRAKDRSRRQYFGDRVHESTERVVRSSSGRVEPFVGL